MLTKNYLNLHLNDETSRYVFRIIVIKEIMENPFNDFNVGELYTNKDIKHIITTQKLSPALGSTNQRFGIFKTSRNRLLITPELNSLIS